MLALLLCAALRPCLPQSADAPAPLRAERVGLCMGTRLRAEVTAAPELAQASLEAAWQALASTEERLSTWDTFGPATGVLARANAAAPATWVACDAQTARELECVRAWSAATEGALSATCGAWIELYDLRGAGRWPSATEVRRLLEAPPLGWELSAGRLRRLTAESRFEEGAFGKGAGLDLAVASLRDAGVGDAWLDLGGQVAVLGTPRWIELADPDDRARPVARIRVGDGSVSTTGNSERGRDVAGRRLGHVLDPRRGLPAEDWGALAVRTASALDADCLSTALFVLGPDAALAFAAARPGIDVVCLERDPAGVRVRASAGLGEDLQLCAPGARTIEPMQSVLTSFALSVPIVTGFVAHAQQAATQQAGTQQAGAATSGVQQPPAQQTAGSVESRVATLEAENAELKRRMDALGGELEGFSFRQVVRELGTGIYGLGPAASKVYGIGQGVSIGGYGEMLYENFSGDSKNDQVDFLRAVLYFGYKFDERWVLNTEIEFEHATTSDGPDAGSGADGEVSVEFAYLDYLIDDAFNLRAGLLLLPLGHVNELHEPTVFLGARRPVSETVILPTTWRENGIGAHGDLGDFSYRACIVNAFDAEGFAASGLRGGRQKGAKALAEDFAVAARLDWHATTGVDFGVGAYHGDAGQDLELAGDEIDATTTLVEAHASARWRGWRARALIVRGEVDDVADLNAALAKVGTASIGEELEGQYVELGYDVMPFLSEGSRQSLTPYVRWEEVDTQAAVPSGFSANPANDQEIWTLGVQWQPLDNVVVKLDYMDFDNGDDSAVDQWNVLIGYVF